MPQLNAFVARSFAPQDEKRIQRVLEFLNTFRKAGFFWETAEPAEVESVSKKVRRMIDEKDVFIGFFTKRYPVYKFESKIKGALQVLLGNFKPEVWSAPAWVLQESGYALRGGKELILLREPGVEVFGLQGDLEYIPFDPENLEGVFSKLNEMIHGLLEKAAGTEVKMVVAERKGEKEAVMEQPIAEAPAEQPKQIVEEPDLISRFVEMKEATEKRDFESLVRAWKAGNELIAAGKSKDFDSLAWDCLYFEYRFEAGDADGLETLRRLRAESSSRPEPVAAIARCMLNSGEQEVAANLFLETAQLQSKTNLKARNLVSAAKAYRQAKRYERGKEAINQALSIATGEVREEAIWVQYQLLNDSKKKFFAFATAEAALHENPLLPLRFSLGLDYRRADLNV